MRLQQLIRQHYLWSALVPILLVESTLVILYFVSTAFISHQQANALLDKAQQDIRQLLNKQTEIISLQFDGISRQLDLMQPHFREFYTSSNQTLLASLSPEALRLHSNGAYFVSSKNNNCALYFSPRQPASPEKIERVGLTHYFDKLISLAININPLVIQGYINEANLSRVCPYIKDTPEVFGPHMDMTKENFYYLADQQHNPNRHTVWTEPYNDPAGAGWMVSIITPVYVQDKLVAVGGLDITLETIIDQLLTNKLPWSMQALLLDKSGNILTSPESLKKLLFNSKNKTFTWKPIQNKILSQSEYQQAHRINKKTYVISSSVIQETGWRVVYIADRQAIFAQANDLKALSWHMGFYAIAFLILFYVLFFTFSRHRANSLGRKIAHPVETLTRATQHLRINPATASELETSSQGIQEIDELMNQFNQMSTTLEERTKELIITETEKQVLERLSTTDQLTGLYNRHKGTELYILEQKRGQRSNTPLGLILLDIDHFKQLNDTYGHALGDEVLKGVASILLRNARTLDNIMRWGGEEFLIICSNTQYSELQIVANRFREELAQKDFGIERQVTASFGITQCLLDEPLDDALERADKALYKAKKEGRNQVVGNLD